MSVSLGQQILKERFSSGPWPTGSSGGGGDMTDDSAEILFQSFVPEATVSSSGMGRDGQSLTLAIQDFLCRPRRRPLTKVPWRMVLERLSWRVTCPTHTTFRLLSIARRGYYGPRDANLALHPERWVFSNEFLSLLNFFSFVCLVSLLCWLNYLSTDWLICSWFFSSQLLFDSLVYVSANILTKFNSIHSFSYSLRFWQVLQYTLNRQRQVSELTNYKRPSKTSDHYMQQNPVIAEHASMT